MAGRIRSIKPEILEDEKAASLSDTAWRLWVSTWCIADDHGRFRCSAGFLHGQAFWGSPRRLDDVAAAVDELDVSRLITVYDVNGQTYAFITNWTKHQRVDNAGKARCPGPDEGKVRRDSPRTSAARGTLPPDLRPPISTSDLDPDPDRSSSTTSDDSPTNGHSSTNGSQTALASKATTSVIEAFNRAFSRKLSPKGWDDAVKKVLAKGFSEAEMRGVVWWAAIEWADKPEMRDRLTPKTLLKLQSSQGYRTFREYLSCAGEKWRELHGGEEPPWEAGES